MTTKALQKAERTKQTIIGESAVLFNQKGYAGTSMDDIMRATGLSKGGLYSHFKSKEEIALAAFEHAVQKVTQRVRERTQEIKHPLDKLRASVDFYRENIFTPPVEGGCPIQNTSIEVDDSNPVLRDRVQEAMDYWKHGIIYILRKGIEQGIVRADTDVEAFSIRFIGTLEGAILLARLYQDVQYFDVMAKQLLDMINGLERENL
jgi:AcrR family transcriptional regulator